eukprot:NODE_44_length_28780_cov_0.148496.p6 type:complete len:412 gc:universal NODE_44_length_28780_cov_0.148496:23823-22588(-)
MTQGIFILFYAQSFVDFRVPELDSLMKLHNRTFEVLHFNDDCPFVVVSTNGDETPFLRSVLIKSVYSFLYQASTIKDIVDQLNSADYREYIHSSFRITVHSHGNTSDRMAIITEVGKNMGLLGKANLTQFEQQFGICLYHNVHKELKQVFLGRLITSDTQHGAPYQFSLKTRHYIGTTSMDALLSLLMCNCGLVKSGTFVYDPFVGTGSMLLSASYYGAFTMGSDLDGRQIKGTMKGAKPNSQGIYGNFEQYKLLDRYFGCLVFDFSNHPIRSVPFFDAILCDPPYCIRASAKKITSNNKDDFGKIVDNFPDTEMYGLDEIVHDLLDFAANHLKIGGRLIYWLPLLHEDGKKSNIPSHPSLQLLHAPGQVFGKWTRYMVIMEKKKDYEKKNKLYNGNDILKFRQGYFRRNE